MRINDLLHDYGIDVAPEGGRHYRQGWVNIECPFCTGHPGYHLGFNLTDNYFRCWRCGFKPTITVITKLLNVDKAQAYTILHQYDGTSKEYHRSANANIKIGIKRHKLPSDTGPMTNKYKQYLAKRGFDPDKLEHEWNLLGTGPFSELDGVNYKYRILAPIYWDGKEVSFQCRDITGKSKLRYITCPKDREVVHHKHILYGDQSKWTSAIICVEGITDVWRLGPEVAVATFGIEFMIEQVNVLSKNFKRVIIIFDNEPQAQKQANKLQALLAVRGISTKVEMVPDDPANLTDKEAQNLIRKIYAVQIGNSLGGNEIWRL